MEKDNYEAGMWRGKKIEEGMDGRNIYDVRDESGGTEGCGRESVLVEKPDNDDR